jgi:C1A family cysteine protease
MDSAFKYLENGVSIEQESDYPYEGYTFSKCREDAAKGVVTVTDFVDVAVNDQDQLIAALQKNPVSVAIEADTFIFQFYRSGVFDDVSCGTNLDHGVLAVGFGTDAASGKDYFIVKNSWGPSWGDKGFIKIAKNTTQQAGICGIASQPSYPVVDAPKH